MPRITRTALIQAANALPDSDDLAAIKKAMIDKHVTLIEEAAEKGANVCCLQEIFYGPYFCAEQNTRWYDIAEPSPTAQPSNSCSNSPKNTAWSWSSQSTKPP